jgi:hypothetical protein
MEEREGWSDSIIRTNSLVIHYYKDSISLCGRSVVDNGNLHFDKSARNLTDKYSNHCVFCIKKQLKLIEN